MNKKTEKMKNEKKKLDEKVEEMKLEINNLRAFDERIIKKFDEMDETFKSIKIQFMNDGNLNTEIKLLKEKVNLLENYLLQLKQDVGKKNKKNLEEIAKLKIEIKVLNERNKELQSLIVGRKLIKIYLYLK